MTMLNANKSNSISNHVISSASAMSDLLGITFCAHVLSKEMSWILDIGAIDHMVCSADLLTTKSSITN